MLYRFEIELSDIDREIYQTLEFRIAQHPSEIAPYLLCRVLAYALSYQEGIEFTGAGLGDPEAPALKAPGLQGTIDLWIEIGNPSARKLHRASKAAKSVVVYTYKNRNHLLEEIRSEKVHRADELKIFAIDPKFLEILATKLEKSNRWSILKQENQLNVNLGNQTLHTEIK